MDDNILSLDLHVVYCKISQASRQNRFKGQVFLTPTFTLIPLPCCSISEYK